MKVTVPDSDGPIVLGARSKVEGILALYGSKSSNGMKCFNFHSIYRNNISKSGFLSYSLKC